MAKTPKQLFRFHVANLRYVEIGLDRVGLNARSAVAASQPILIDTFKRLYALLLGVWAECRLSKLLYEPNGFDALAREAIFAEPTQLGRWLKLTELAFRKHYGVPRAPLSATTLPHSAYSRLKALNETVDTDLRFVITLRNKLAHGQWAYPLNESGDDVAQEQMDALRTENVLSLQFKRTILDNLLNAVLDLVVSKSTFERDFDSHVGNVERARQNLKTRTYATYEQAMRQKYERGRVSRKKPGGGMDGV